MQENYTSTNAPTIEMIFQQGFVHYILENDFHKTFEDLANLSSLNRTLFKAVHAFLQPKVLSQYALIFKHLPSFKEKKYYPYYQETLPEAWWFKELQSLQDYDEHGDFLYTDFYRRIHQISLALIPSLEKQEYPNEVVSIENSRNYILIMRQYEVLTSVLASLILDRQISYLQRDGQGFHRPSNTVTQEYQTKELFLLTELPFASQLKPSDFLLLSENKRTALLTRLSLYVFWLYNLLKPEEKDDRNIEKLEVLLSYYRIEQILPQIFPNVRIYSRYKRLVRSLMAQQRSPLSLDTFKLIKSKFALSHHRFLMPFEEDFGFLECCLNKCSPTDIKAYLRSIQTELFKLYDLQQLTEKDRSDITKLELFLSRYEIEIILCNPPIDDLSDKQRKSYKKLVGSLVAQQNASLSLNTLSHINNTLTLSRLDLEIFFEEDLNFLQCCFNKCSLTNIESFLRNFKAYVFKDESSYWDFLKVITLNCPSLFQDQNFIERLWKTSSLLYKKPMPAYEAHQKFIADASSQFASDSVGKVSYQPIFVALPPQASSTANNNLTLAHHFTSTS